MTIASFGQSVTKKTTYQVFDNLISSIGNYSVITPTLIIANTNRNPASYNPSNSTIKIENKVLEICYSFGADSLNALSYILAHELGHHYQNHGYNARYASLDFSNEIEKTVEANNRRVDNESQADVYAGFYAHISGYNSLDIASDFLKTIYREYDLPDYIKNYPTLSQRIEIIKKNKDDFETLKNIFELANLNIAVGNYEISQKLYKYILNYGFNSREIHNNLGLSYVYQALNLGVEKKFIKIILPFKLDFNSRLSNNQINRSLNEKQYAVNLLKLAIKEFEIALMLDPKYLTSFENIFHSQLALKLLDQPNNFDKCIDEVTNINNSCNYCTRGLIAFSNNNLKKANNLFKRGSINCIYCGLNQNFNNQNLTPEKQNDILTEFDMYDLVYNAIDMNCLDIDYNSQNSFYQKINSLRVSITYENGMNIIKFKERKNTEYMCVTFHEYFENSQSFANELDINIGAHISDIIGKYDNLRVIDSGVKKYIFIESKNLTFLIVDDIVSKWFYHKKLN